MTIDSAAPVVTVIVPAWNVAGYVPDAIASLQAQTLTSWQAVLIDDASDDATAAVLDGATADDRRFEVVRLPEHVGLGAARNAGLDRVATPFTAFLDADDIMRPRALETLLGLLESSGSELAVGAYVRVHHRADGLERGEVQPWVRQATHPAAAGASLIDRPAVTTNVVAWSKVTRTALWRRTGVRFPEGMLYEDQLVAQQLYLAARGIDITPDVVVDWRVRPDGSSITQHEDEPVVFRACTAALLAGLRELAPVPAAQRMRLRMIREMDLARLTSVAREVPVLQGDLDAFVEELDALAAHSGGS